MSSVLSTSHTVRDVSKLRSSITRALIGKEEAIDLTLAGLLARGHILIEDVPGIGKTTLARALARSIHCDFQRIQFTSDLLPSDIIGVTIFNQTTQSFEFKSGPLFANIVLADEVNRATPKTQSALLEAMSEAQVSVDGITHRLAEPFLVLATQNPVEYHGTYPLPEAQLDRFLLRIVIGYPDRETERAIVTRSEGLISPDELEPVVEPADVIRLQEEVESVRVDDTLLEYLLSVVSATRAGTGIELGVSPRAANGWYRIAQAMALLDGRDYVVPDDLTRTAVPCLAHRIVPAVQFQADGERGGQGRRAIEDILEHIAIPR